MTAFLGTLLAVLIPAIIFTRRVRDLERRIEALERPNPMHAREPNRKDEA